MKLITISLTLLLAGCANTGLDRDFRSKVSGVDHTTRLSSDGKNSSVESAWHFEMRDPSDK